MMSPKVIKATPQNNYSLLLTFTNGEQRVFDVTPYLDKGIFQELRDKAYFQAVKVFLGSVFWPNEQDFCPDTLYEKSVLVNPTVN